MIPFPQIDPIALQIGSLAIRWYALAYVVGILLGWAYASRLARTHTHGITPRHIEDSLAWIIAGIILGGRLGYVLFYNFDYYAHAPLDALKIWHGGMAFHGGLLGVIAALFLFCRQQKIRFLAFMDIIACVTPIGLFFGRLANFINGELYGRITNAPWGMVFPHGGDLPRHPSQLYQAGLEGLVLLLIMTLLAFRTQAAQRMGVLSGAFLIGYGIFRNVGEIFREPDTQIGFLMGGITMGQLLSLPMIALGAFLILRAFSKKNHDPA